MTLFKGPSIRAKLKLAILSTSFLSVVLVFAGLFLNEYVTYNQLLVNDLSTKADIIAKNSDAALAFGNTTDAEQVLKSLATQPNIIAAAIYGRDRRLFATYRRDGESISIPYRPTQPGSWYENNTLALSKPIILNGDQIGTIYINTDLVGREAHFWAFTQIALLVLLGSLAVAFIVATVLEKNISKPILSLAGTTRRISEQRDYSIRAVKVSDDETGYLADGVNQMLAQIQEHDINLRRTNEAMVEEIAERKRVEKALRFAETQLRVITETTPLLLTRCNREKEYIYVNRAAAKTMGASPEEIIGKPMPVILGAERYRPLSRYVDIVLEGVPVEFDIEMRFPHIGQRFFHVAYSPDTNERGAVIGWFESTSDITESKLTEQALRASEERFSQFMSNLPGAAWIKDWSGRYVYANEEGCRIFGRTRAELYGKTDEEIFPAETALQFKENDERAKESGAGIQSIETLHHGGALRYSIVTKFPVLGHTGNVELVGGIAIDVTERKKAEEALHESERRSHLALSQLAAIVESSSDAIIGMDLNGIVTSWNAGATRMFGYTPDEIIGQPVFNLVPPEYHIQEGFILEQLRHGERIDPFDATRTKKGGSRVNVSLSISPVKDSSGNIVGSSKIARDITERKRAEDAIRESESRFRHLVLSMPVALYTTDREGRITLFNEPAAELWGRRPEIGKDFWCGSWRIFRSDGTPMEIADCPMAVSLREKRPIRGEEMIIQRPDGTKSYVLPHPEPLRDASGELSGAINMLVDITDRKQAEEALRKAHDELEIRVRERTADLLTANEELRKRDIQLSTAQQIAQLGSWEWEIQKSKVTWSEELYHIYGIRDGGFGGTLESFLELLHPEDRDTTLGHIQEAVRTQQPFDFEERIVRPDGGIRILHSQGRVVTDENGQVVKLLGVCLDVTDRKRADKRFHDLLESAPDAVVIVNSEGCIVIVNAQTELLFGYARSELIGQRLELLIPERFKRNHVAHRNDYFLNPLSRSMGAGLELYGMRKDKTEFPVSISLSPIETEDGKLISSSIRDVTEQKRMQEELVAFERRRFTELRRFARSAQHAQEEERLRIARELHDGVCQTLSGMKLKAESIEEEAASIDIGFSNKLHNFNRQYEGVIDEIRRMSTNLRPAALDDFGFGVAVNLLVREFKAMHKVPVNLTIDESIELDPQTEIAFYRITQESLTNTAKYASAANVNILLKENEGMIMLKICDDGRGFDPAEVSIRKDPYHGFGLVGMRDRVEMLGGDFTIESASGQGTTITITVPKNGKEEK